MSQRTQHAALLAPPPLPPAGTLELFRDEAEGRTVYRVVLPVIAAEVRSAVVAEWEARQQKAAAAAAAAAAEAANRPPAPPLPPLLHAAGSPSESPLRTGSTGPGELDESAASAAAEGDRDEEDEADADHPVLPVPVAQGSWAALSRALCHAPTHMHGTERPFERHGPVTMLPLPLPPPAGSVTGSFHPAVGRSGSGSASRSGGSGRAGTSILSSPAQRQGSGSDAVTPTGPGVDVTAHSSGVRALRPDAAVGGRVAFDLSAITTAATGPLAAVPPERRTSALTGSSWNEAGLSSRAGGGSTAAMPHGGALEVGGRDGAGGAGGGEGAVVVAVAAPAVVARDGSVGDVAGASPTGRGVARAPRKGPAPLGLHLLCVDDEKTNQLVLRRMLTQLGCTFDLVDEGDEAIAALLRSGQARLPAVGAGGDGGLPPVISHAVALVRASGGEIGGDMGVEGAGVAAGGGAGGVGLPPVVEEGAVRRYDAVLCDIIMKRTNGLDTLVQMRDVLGVTLPIIATSGNRPSAEYFAPHRFTAMLEKPFLPPAVREVLLEAVPGAAVRHTGRTRRGGGGGGGGGGVGSGGGAGLGDGVSVGSGGR
jgi:CheY-like chemotaxis protein